MFRRWPRFFAGRRLAFLLSVMQAKKYFESVFQGDNMLKEGDVAPDFTTRDQDGGEVKLSGFKGKKVVLFFYPKDATPG